MTVLRLAAAAACLLLAACGAPAAKTYQGEIAHDEEVLAFDVAGRVEAVTVSEGERIAAGVALARLDARDLDLAVAEATAQLAVAEAEVARIAAPARPEEIADAEAALAAARSARDTAARELERDQALRRQDVASQRALDTAQDAAAQTAAAFARAEARLALLRAGARSEEIAVARARAEAARAALARAAADRAHAVLRAPPGPRLVRHVHARPGEYAARGTPAITVADESRPYVDAFVPQGDLAALRVGGAATVRTDGGGESAGTIERIGERLEFTPRQLYGPQDRPNLVARVRVRLAAPLHAGVPADVAFAP